MRIGSKGKYTRQIRSRPRGLGTCDYSGLMVQHKRMVQQYEYSGSGLYWTGFWVNPKYADVPNPQNLIPLIRLDPVPLPHPRPDPIVYDDRITSITIDVSGSENILLTAEQLDNMVLNFEGVLGSNIIVFIPNILTEFYANNKVTGGFTLSIQIEGDVSTPLEIPPVNPVTRMGPLVSNDFLKLSFVYH